MQNENKRNQNWYCISDKLALIFWQSLWNFFCLEKVDKFQFQISANRVIFWYTIEVFLLSQFLVTTDVCLQPICQCSQSTNKMAPNPCCCRNQDQSAVLSKIFCLVLSKIFDIDKVSSAKQPSSSAQVKIKTKECLAENNMNFKLNQ